MSSGIISAGAFFFFSSTSFVLPGYIIYHRRFLTASEKRHEWRIGTSGVRVEKKKSRRNAM